MNIKSRNPTSFDCPALYQISVEGSIDQSLSDRLEGMTIYQATDKELCPVTYLEGELSDQAALAGVLNMLYELHLPVILVKRLEI